MLVTRCQCLPKISSFLFFGFFLKLKHCTVSLKDGLSIWSQTKSYGAIGSTLSKNVFYQCNDPLYREQSALRQPISLLPLPSVTLPPSPLLSSLLTIAPSLFPSLALQAAVSVAVAPGKARRTLTSSRILPNIFMQYKHCHAIQQKHFLCNTTWPCKHLHPMLHIPFTWKSVTCEVQGSVWSAAPQDN